MKLYTKGGDGGETGLLGGKRVAKDDVRVAAYGAVDELNAAIGLAAAALAGSEWRDDLQAIQRDLFVLGAQLATGDGASPKHVLSADRVATLEAWIDALTADAPALRNFVLPGGSEPAARFHLARTVCRRAERAVVTLARTATVGGEALAYLNRLGDLLFAYALAANRRAGVADTVWKAP